MSAGITYRGYYTEEDYDDFLEEPEGVFDNNLHGLAVESFQTGSFYRNVNQPPLRSSYTGTFRPSRALYDHYGYAQPDQEQSGEWFRPSGRFSNAEAVYSYSSDEPFEPMGKPNIFKEQVRQVGDDLFHNRKVGSVVILAVLALLVLGLFTWVNTFGRAEAEGDIYQFSASSMHSLATQAAAASENKPQGNPPSALPGAHAVSGVPTISADKIAQVLKQYNSPAVGASQAIYDLGVKYQIDPAYALAFFIHESSAGTKGIAVTTRSLGNIRQTTNSGFEGYNGFRKYPSWEVGAEDWYKLIKNLYIGGWNLTTVEQIIPKYAPSEDNNNPASYINAVNTLVDSWRSGK